MKLFPGLSAACFIACIPQSAVADRLHWQQPDYIESSFLNIALQREHGRPSALLNKWQSPLLFYIDDRTADSDLHGRMVRQHLQHLASITGLQINGETSPEKANLKIIFSSELQLETELQKDLGVTNKAFRSQIMLGSVCLGRIFVAGNGSIKKATVIIPVDRARAHGKLMACVVEELTQVLGLVNDSSKVYPSIFNDRSFNNFLSGLDFLLLKLLYHPELKAGMSKQEVQRTVRKIIAGNQFQSLIPRAEKAVRAGSLENWLP